MDEEPEINWLLFHFICLYLSIFVLFFFHLTLTHRVDAIGKTISFRNEP